MYCIKCGADNLETAKFCRKCGESFEAEEETRVAVRGEGSLAASMGGDADTDSQEAEIFAISPTLMFVKIGYALAALGALFLAAFTSVFLSSWISVWLSVFIGLLLFLIPAYYHFKRKMVSYKLTESKLEIDEGFISRTTRSVPIRRIQDVTVSSTMLQRMLGFGNLTIDNASDDGGKVVMKNINTPKFYADVLLRQMRRLDQ
ncbi:MAG: PH domain-containing protein [Pyrinomonadaceae bacterium]